jgi:hypothetical protein
MQDSGGEGAIRETATGGCFSAGTHAYNQKYGKKNKTPDG